MHMNCAAVTQQNSSTHLLKPLSPALQVVVRALVEGAERALQPGGEQNQQLTIRQILTEQYATDMALLSTHQRVDGR